jgi:hypothetical protein
MMRLYRGLTKPHRPEKVPQFPDGTNFTDCAFTALLYARDPRGELLVIDLPDDDRRTHKALWFDDGPERYFVYGPFDRFFVARIPAKELRKIAGRKGGISAHREYRSYQLSSRIDEALKDAVQLPILTLKRPAPPILAGSKGSPDEWFPFADEQPVQVRRVRDDQRP